MRTKEQMNERKQEKERIQWILINNYKYYLKQRKI